MTSRHRYVYHAHIDNLFLPHVAAQSLVYATVISVADPAGGGTAPYSLILTNLRKSLKCKKLTGNHGRLQNAPEKNQGSVLPQTGESQYSSS